MYDAKYTWWVSATDGAGNVGPDSETSNCLVSGEDHPAPDTTVTAPNGGEVLEGGSTYAVTWYALDQDFTSTTDLKVGIYFSHDYGSSWEQIATMENNPGAYAWNVPDNTYDESCLIRVTTENRAGMLGSDDSDFPFSIVSSSSGGETGGEQASVAGMGGGGGGGCFIAALSDRE